jgi:hypothetical protein
MGIKKKEEKEAPTVCYFCLWNAPVTEIHKGKQVLHACRYCASVMQPLANSESPEGGTWGFAIASLRPIHPDGAKFQDKPRLKCAFCSFKTVFEDSLRHHNLYSHRPGHNNPFSLDKLSDIEKDKWVKALGRQLH